MRKWHDLGPFTIFDLETTGMSPVYDRIVEIAAIKIDCAGTQSRFHSLINPERDIPYQITKLNGITNETVADSPFFKTVGPEFHEFARGTILVAHNARFDLAFLQESLCRNGLDIWNGKTLDSIPLIKQAYPGLPSYSLQSLRQRFGLGDGFGQAHRAYADVEWTLEIFRMTMKNLLDREA